jgi:asparagine synthase (glutamine-hydrolysing)
MNGSPSTSTCALAGSIDLRVEPAWSVEPRFASAIAAQDDGWRCEQPGFLAAWSGSRAAHAARDDALCIVWGSPRLATGNGAPPRQTAARLLDELCASGARAFAGIRGGYGLLFIDARARRLLLAVDRFAIETACYGVDGDRLAFSDRADAVPVRTRTLSAQTIHDYLYFHCVAAPSTAFREVSRLRNGEYLSLERGELRTAAHWHPRFDETPRDGLASLGGRFRGLVRDAVAREAGSAETLGCFLSGGTDSSTIAGMLCEVTGAPARTYSIGFDAPGYDEMHFARIAARHFGTDHHEYYVTADDVARSIGDVASFVDQPFGNSSVVPAYFCARAARSDGVTRMLAGDGGDELFGGNARYALQQLLDAYRRVPRLVRDRLIEPLVDGRLGATTIPGLRHVAAYVRNARVPMPDRMESFNLLRRVGTERVLAPALLASVDGEAPLRAQRDAYARAPTASTINRMLFYDWEFTLADTDLPKVRTAAALAGLTVGYPLLADEIADFSLGLPPSYKVRNTKLRWFFKRALRDFLPDAIIRKKKHGFGLPFGLWATSHRGLREIAADSLAGLERRGILRAAFRDPLLTELLPRHPAYYGELVWILVMLEQWLARHPEASVGWTAATPALAAGERSPAR